MREKDFRAMTAEEIVRRYWKGFRLLRGVYYALLAVYLLFLLWLAVGPLRDFRWWFLTYLVSLGAAFLCLRLVRVVNSRHYLQLEQILTQDCDAVKYTEVCRLLRSRMKRSTGMVKLNETKGLVFSGQFREAAALLEDVELKKPQLAVKLLYQNVAFNCAVLLGEGRHAEETRRETERLLKKKRPGKAVRQAGEQLLTLMDAGLAFQREDYETLRSLETRLEGMYTVPLQFVTSAYRLARADLAQGETEGARARLTYVAEHGGTLYVTGEARRLLAELEQN